MFKSILKKFKEAAMGVIPITIILLIVNFAVSPMSTGNLISFLVGALLLVLGLALYNFGCGSSIEFIGGQTGSHVSKTSKLWLILALCGIIGFVVTVAEPDLSVLAEQVSGIDNFVLIAAIALGVGVFMLIAVLRLVLKIELRYSGHLFYRSGFRRYDFKPYKEPFGRRFRGGLDRNIEQLRRRAQKLRGKLPEVFKGNGYSSCSYNYILFGV